jgi:hypothetical protein
VNSFRCFAYGRGSCHGASFRAWPDAVGA